LKSLTFRVINVASCIIAPAAIIASGIFIDPDLRNSMTLKISMDSCKPAAAYIKMFESMKYFIVLMTIHPEYFAARQPDLYQVTAILPHFYMYPIASCYPLIPRVLLSAPGYL
jgi:hypothetical protein